jgi:plastocyanin
MKQRFLSFATTALMLLGSSVAAVAAVHNVSVNSNFFQPSTLTIQVGDQVIWTQVSGAHNGNGSKGTFPNNPASFSSGAVAGGNWTYSFTFTIPGTYSYQCDPHAGMDGTIVVQPAAAQPLDLRRAHAARPQIHRRRRPARRTRWPRRAGLFHRRKSGRRHPGHSAGLFCF